MSRPRPSHRASDAGASLPVSRRRILQGTGAVGLGALLAACGGDGGATGTGTTGTGTGAATPGPVDATDAAQTALDAAGVDAPLVLTPIIATFEVVTGTASRIQFGLLDESREPLLDADLEVYLVGADDGELVQGPVEPIFHGEDLGARGVYVFDAELDQPGLHDLVVATSDGSAAGTAAVRALAPEDSAVVQVGAEFPAIPTPTEDDPGDLAELCTRDPDCGMHGISLDTALQEGRPVVLTIATPKYCQTAVCGPVVDVVLEQKEAVDRDDIAFIHAEVYTDAGNTPTGIITELALPSEPWTFLIGGDGTVKDRFDGPVVPDLLAESIETHL